MKKLSSKLLISSLLFSLIPSQTFAQVIDLNNSISPTLQPTVIEQPTIIKQPTIQPKTCDQIDCEHGCTDGKCNPAPASTTIKPEVQQPTIIPQATVTPTIQPTAQPKTCDQIDCEHGCTDGKCNSAPASTTIKPEVQQPTIIPQATVTPTIQPTVNIDQQKKEETSKSAPAASLFETQILKNNINLQELKDVQTTNINTIFQPEEKKVVELKELEKKFQTLEKLPATNTTKIQEFEYKTGITDFKDVPSKEWFFPSIKRLSNLGAVSGYKDKSGNLLGEFRPTNPVGINESLKIILESSGKGKTRNVSPKNPKAQNTWAQEYFAKADELGLEAAQFDPNRQATRGEVACMIQKVFELPDASNLQLTFADLKADNKNYACIQAVVKSGIMKGDDKGNTFRPDAGINRAEVSITTSRSIDFLANTVQYICPKPEDTQNILIHEVSAERLEESNGDARIFKGEYYVKYKVGVLNTGSKNMTNVDLDIFRHDVKTFNSGFAEHIVQLKTPKSWKNLTLEPGRYKYVEAIVPVPVKTYQASTYVEGGTSYDMAQITVVADLPENNINEIIDLSDNIGTARVLLNKYNNSPLADGFIHRTIQTGREADQTVSGNVATKFNSYNSSAVNAFKKASKVMASYFQPITKKADEWSKHCLNFTAQPGSFSVKQQSVGADKTKVQVKAKIVKEGTINLANHTRSGYATLFAKQRHTSKPAQIIDWWRLDRASGFGKNEDTGTQARVVGEIDTIREVPTKFKDAEFTLAIDFENEITERNENDNLFSQNLSITGAGLAACSVNPNTAHDIIIANLQFDKNSIKKLGTNDYEVAITADIISKNKNAEDINIHMFEPRMERKNNQIHETLKEINVPNDWKLLDLKANQLNTLKAKIVLDGDSIVFNDDRKSIGNHIILTADLPENKYSEIDDLGNNITSTFIGVQSAQSADRLFDIKNLKNFVRDVQEVSSQQYALARYTNSFASDLEFGSYKNAVVTKQLYDDKKSRAQSLRDFYQSTHKISSVDASVSKLCTNLKVESFNVSQTGTSDRSLLVNVNAEISKTGPFPLPTSFKSAQFYYRPLNSSIPFRIAYTWDQNDLQRTDGSSVFFSGITPTTTQASQSSNTIIQGGTLSNNGHLNYAKPVNYKLNVTGLSIKPTIDYYANDYEFRILLDPEKVIAESDEQDNEKINKGTLYTNKNVDLKPKNLSFGKVYFDQSGNPKVDLSYEIVNFGGNEVNTEFKVEFGRLKDGSHTEYDFKESWPVFEVKNGKFTGKRSLNLPRTFKPIGRYVMRVDTGKDLLESDRHNNEIIWSKDPLVIEKDLAAYVDISNQTLKKGNRSMAKFDGSEQTIDTYQIGVDFAVDQLSANPTKTLNTFVDNGQAFPLKFEEKSKPFEYHSEPLHLRKFWFGGLHNWKYKEKVDEKGIVFRGGLVRVDCSSRCDYVGAFHDRVTSGSSNGIGIARGFFGNDKDKNLASESGNNRAYPLTVYPAASPADYHNDWKYTYNFMVPAEDATYIAYGGLIKHWSTNHITDRYTNNMPDLWVTRFSAEWRRIVERAFKDTYTANNYNFQKITVSNGKMSISEISAQEAKQLAQSASKKFSRHVPTSENIPASTYNYFPWGFEDILKAY